MPYKDPDIARAKNLVYQRAYYARNPEYYKQKAAERQRRLTAIIRTEKSRPCTDCSVEYPWYVMDFDHCGEKEFNLSGAARMGWSEQRIRAEIAKCEIVCANCHRIRSHRRRADQGLDPLAGA
jgi:hypothetical protein